MEYFRNTVLARGKKIMGCCYSLPSTVDSRQNNKGVPSLQPGIVGGEDLSLTKFSFFDLKTATKNFSSENIVSEEASNVVYKGRLQNGDFIAVKKLTNTAWPDPNHFVEEVQRVGNLSHKRLVNLIGYCYDGDERLLVAEFLPNDTLAKRLFYYRLTETNQPMDWSTRYQVVYCLAEALDYCSNAGFGSYNNLSPYSVLFDKDGDACLSCFGLIKQINDDQTTRGSVSPKSVTFRFGTVLVNLLTGQKIPPSHAAEMIHGKSVIQLMDPSLEGNFSIEEATIVLKLASQCLQYEDLESPNIKDLVATLETLKTETEVLTFEHVEMATQQQNEASSSTDLSPLGEACSRMDLASIHKFLVTAGYEDDKEVTEFSFEEWIQEIQDVQEIRRNGDQAFEEQDFKTAIDNYTEFVKAKRIVYPSVYARRSLCYLFCNDPEEALRDGMLAQQAFPDWPTALYLESVALAKLNMNTDSSDTLKEATILEAKRKQQREGSFIFASRILQ